MREPGTTIGSRWSTGALRTGTPYQPTRATTALAIASSSFVGTTITVT